MYPTVVCSLRGLRIPWGRRLGWVAVIWVVVFWRLGYASLLDPDEAHYAELTREMLRAKQWLVPLLDGSPYIDKPFLFHWLQGLSVLLFGPTEFAFRLPSALGAVALILTTWWLGAALFSRAIGESAALMVATVPATFALASIGMIDMVNTAFLFGAVAFLLVAAFRRRARLQYVGYVLLALAVITKGPVALVLVGLFAAGAVAAGRAVREPILRLNWFRGLLIVAAIASPWFTWMWRAFGQQFVESYILSGNLWYFTEPASFSLRTTSYAFYLRILVTALFPWSIIAIGRLIDVVIVRSRAPIEPEARTLWIWMLVVLGFFSAARFRLDHYIFPATPACCLLAARAWNSAASDRRWRATRIAIGAVAATLMIAAAITSAAIYEIDLGLGATALALPLTLALGGAAIAIQMVRKHGLAPDNATALVATLVGAYAAVVTIGLPVLERSRPTAPLGRWIAQNSAPEAVVGSYGLEDWRASIRYYADRRVVTLESLDAVRAFFEQRPDGYVLMRARDYRALRRAGLDLHGAGELPAIVGRTGRYFRRQVWGRIMIVTLTGRTHPPLRGPST